MGSAELADPASIPRVKSLDEQDWLPGFGVLDYDAEAQLINDNLTDLSHLPFVHGQSFAATDEFAASLPTVTQIDNGVRIQRWAERQPPLGVPDATELFDAFLSYDYLVPGIFSLRARQFPVGTFQSLGGAVPPDELPGRDIWSSQAVTPLANGRARYFFSQGPGKPVPQEFSDFLWEVALGAFAEDRVMIEGQQRIIDLEPGRRIMPALGDKGTVLFSRLVERMIRLERGGVDAALTEPRRGSN
jgi:vanillate O-demethylase monooxygenase subunit